VLGRKLGSDAKRVESVAHGIGGSAEDGRGTLGEPENYRKEK